MNFCFEKYHLPTLGWTRLPNPPISSEDKQSVGLLENCSDIDFLRTIVLNGFEEKVKKGKIDKNNIDKYKNQINLELNTFEELFFTKYILLVWATINKARSLGVFIDYGRGSAASSLCFWLIDVTGCDPIKYGLFFPRFVSKARAKSQVIDGEIWISNDLAPDVDLNLGDGRDEIVKWLNDIYPNRVCKISNAATFTGKICIKDVYKTYSEVDEEESKRVSDLIEKNQGIVQKISAAYESGGAFQKWAKENIDVYNISLSLEGLIRQVSTHASGYLISFDELTDHTPLILSADKDTGEKHVTSNYTMNDVQCLKLDLLGLDTNRLIKNILNTTKEDIDNINLENDPIIYDQFQNNNLLPYGLYQISAATAYKVCMNMKPKNIMELSHVNAIARPATLVYEKSYIENKAECPNPLFEKALGWTRYQPLYQEQTIAMIVAIGFSAEEAEGFRKIFAKKHTEKTDEVIEKIKAKVKESNFPEVAAEVLIRIAKEAAKYQFNLCLSPDTVVETENGYKMMFEVNKGDKIKGYDIDNNKDVFVEILNKYENKTEIYEVELEDGRKIKASMAHKFLCNDLTMRTLEEIIVNKFKIMTD